MRLINFFSKNIKSYIRTILKIFGFEILKHREVLSLRSDAHQASIVRNWLLEPKIDPKFLKFILSNIPNSRSQLQQDLLAQFVHMNSNQTHPGFFVEFGATDGIGISNTYLLESIGWNGILAEPARNWQIALKNNRKAKIDFRCVYSKSDQEIDFFESASFEYSTINNLRYSDGHFGERKVGTIYPVETVSLENLLKENDAPSLITYLSIDTEGSEWEILSNFDFKSFEIILMSIEHNYNLNRGKVSELLQSNGFTRILQQISGFEDWFINPKYFDTEKLIKSD